jgi:hypothetical protein
MTTKRQQPLSYSFIELQLIVGDFFIYPKHMQAVQRCIILEVDVEIGVWRVGKCDGLGHRATSQWYIHSGAKQDGDGSIGHLHDVIVERSVER